jgi:cystathionine beta-lyase/cystathionine gamma-synthase
MSPRKNLWYGAVAVAGVVLLASQSYRTADASAMVARTKAIVNAPQKADTICWHDDASVYHGCGDFTMSANVKSVSVTVTYTDGHTWMLISGPKTDAIFLSKPAAENFLARYYRATRQTAKLTALTKKLQTAVIH